MKKRNLAVITAVFSLSLFANGYIYAQSSSPVKITGWGMHYGGQVVYRYQVQNLGQAPIKTFMIGLYQPETGEGSAELSVSPLTNGSTFWLPSNIALSPNGWGVSLFFPEESEKFALEWIEAGYHKALWPAAPQDQDAPTVKNPPIVIAPQTTLDIFSITLKRPDFSYMTGHARVNYGDKTLTFPIQKGDTLPPTLTLSVNRVNQNESNGKWAIFDVEASTKDNYDPSPTLVFEPVLSSQPLQNGDVIIDTKRDGWKVKVKNVTGRTYQLRFTSQDASGNTSVKTFDYVVTADKDDNKDHDHGNNRKNPKRKL